MSTTIPLDGLVQRKGAAEKPADAAQRAASQDAGAVEPKTKSLTLRLSERDYERLRRFAFDRKTTHQAVIEKALIAYLDSAAG